MSEAWARNTAEEALLGVSLTGIMDNALTSGLLGADKLTHTLNSMRDHARLVNAEWAEALGIKPSAAITCVKPSGCTSLETRIKTVDGDKISMAEIFTRAGYEPDLLGELKPNSWLPIDAGVVLPHVLDENNQPQEITALYVNGMAEVFEITFEDGKSFKFTGNHKLKLKSGEWKRVDQLAEDDDIASF